MSDILQLQNETNKRLRAISSQLCCLTNDYNTLGQVALLAAGTKTFAIKSVHSVAWDLDTGASITISIDGGTAVTYRKEGGIEFSSFNENSIVIIAVGGAVSLMWTY